MMNKTYTESRPALLRVVGRWQLFALAFACIAGSGWLLVLGDWLNAAAPGGAILGLMAGTSVMLAVCAGYAELAARVPVAGGEFEYARRVFGRRTAFLVGWFSTLFLLAVAAFEGIALSWIVGVLWPPSGGPTLYHLFGAPITSGALAIGVGGAVALAWVNHRGIASAARLQAIVTYGFLALAALAIILGIGLGSMSNLSPVFVPLKAQPWWIGALWIFATTPFFLNGFQSVPQVIEERAEGIWFGTVSRVMYGAIILACLFYCAIILSSAMTTHWIELHGKELPAAATVK